MRVPVILFDLPKDGADKSAIARQAIANLKKLKPSPLGVADEADLIEPANYDEHIGRLGECDLVIEAIAECMDWKHQLYARIAPHLAPHAILANNTSGLSIARACPLASSPSCCRRRCARAPAASTSSTPALHAAGGLHRGALANHRRDRA